MSHIKFTTRGRKTAVILFSPVKQNGETQFKKIECFTDL